MYCKTRTEATSVERVGGKAANLNKIRGLGIRVPGIGHVKADLARIPDGATIRIDGQTGAMHLSPS